MAKKKGKKSAKKNVAPKKTGNAQVAKSAQAAKPAKAAKQKKSPAKASQARAAGASSSMIETIARFFREVKTELKKVTWPSRKQTVSSTGVVLVLVVLISIFLGGVDLILSWLVKQVLGLGA